jgi:hypothetical protein
MYVYLGMMERLIPGMQSRIELMLHLVIISPRLVCEKNSPLNAPYICELSHMKMPDLILSSCASILTMHQD